MRPALYWFWGRVPSAAEAERQVAEMAAAGFSTVMIQARLGLERSTYLSPEWLEGYRAAVAAAGTAGLDVGLYDDYNWISGQAGGRTVAGPEGDRLRERHLFWASAAPGARTASVATVSSPWLDGLGEVGARWIYEDGVRRWDEWSLVAAVAGDVDVTAWATCDGDADGCELSLDPAAPRPAGAPVRFYVSARGASSRLIDYLQPAAAARFLEVSHERYANALGPSLLGPVVSALSFDHPYGGFYTWDGHDGEVGSSLMWNPEAGLLDDPELPAARCLAAVVHDPGPVGRRARVRFFARYAARGIESFLAPLRRWADAHGVGLTGHELFGFVGGWGLFDAFPELDVRTNFGADHFGIDACRTQTLVDAMGTGAQLSPRFGDSVARAHGRAGCTVEQYFARRDPPEAFAAGEWELTLPALRIAVLRLALLGGTRFLFHAFALDDDPGSDPDDHGDGEGSGDGDGEVPRLLADPHFDFPPAINLEPWWPWCRALSDEAAALGEFLGEDAAGAAAPRGGDGVGDGGGGGGPVRDVGLVYPLATIWSDGPAAPCGRIFGAWAQRLAAAGVGYDVVDDRELDAASVADGRVWLGARGYRAIVLPGAATLVSATTVEVLEALAAAGGTVLATAPLPDLTADGSDGGDLAARLAAACALPVTDAVADVVPDVLRALDGAPGFVDPGGPGTVWRWHGRDGRTALLNDSDAPRTVTLDGESIALEPGELRCLRALGPHVTCEMSHVTPRPLAGWGPDAERELADRWTLTVDGRTVPVAVDRGWEVQGFETFAGVGTYRRTIGSVDGDGWWLELPGVQCAATVALNGVELGARGWPPYRFAIDAAILRDGDNHLEVRVANTAANRYYAGTPWWRGPQPSGLTAPPRLRRAAP